MVQIRPMSEFTGGEITDVDVKSLDDNTFTRIYNAWLKFGITVVREQDLNIPDFIAYSRRFGAIVPHPSKSTRHPDYPEITVLGINKFRPDGTLNEAIYKRGAEEFHTDGAYDKIPFKATKLYALAVPQKGGDTHFSSMYRAFDLLPERLKDLLANK